MIVVASNMSKLPTEFANPIRCHSMYFMCNLMIFQRANAHTQADRNQNATGKWQFGISHGDGVGRQSDSTF